MSHTNETRATPRNAAPLMSTQLHHNSFDDASQAGSDAFLAGEAETSVEPRQKTKTWVSEHGGYVKLFRSLRQNKMWQKKPFHPALAFVDLILRANYKDGHVMRGMRVSIPVQRGQVYAPMTVLAKDWGWDRKTVRAFLEGLELDQMVDIKTDKKRDTGGTIISIRNYDLYQSEHDEAVDGKLDIKLDINGTSNGHQRDTPEEVKKVKKERNTLSPAVAADVPVVPVEPEARNGKRKLAARNRPGNAEGFESFWNIYPKKDARKKALEKWNTLRPDEPAQQAMQADIKRRRVSHDWTKDKGQYIPLPATYLNQLRWEDQGTDKLEVAEPERELTMPEIEARGSAKCEGCGGTYYRVNAACPRCKTPRQARKVADAATTATAEVTHVALGSAAAQAPHTLESSFSTIWGAYPGRASRPDPNDPNSNPKLEAFEVWKDIWERITPTMEKVNQVRRDVRGLGTEQLYPHNGGLPPAKFLRFWLAAELTGTDLATVIRGGRPSLTGALATT